MPELSGHLQQTKLQHHHATGSSLEKVGSVIAFTVELQFSAVNDSKLCNICLFMQSTLWSQVTFHDKYAGKVQADAGRRRTPRIIASALLRTIRRKEMTGNIGKGVNSLPHTLDETVSGGK